MQYQGGKFYLGKHLAPYILRHNPERIIEPFIGGGNVTVHLVKAGFDGVIIAGDYNEQLNRFWEATFDEGFRPTYDDMPTREEYHAMKLSGDTTNPLVGFARTSGTFGSKPWGSYYADWIRNGERDTYWNMSINSHNRAMKHLAAADIQIWGGDYSTYSEFITPESVVYCDPPYRGTAGYGHEFDHDRFWETVRTWSETCPVYVSELTAPDDFVAVWSKGHKHQTAQKTHKTVQESLFVHKSRAE